MLSIRGLDNTNIWDASESKYQVYSTTFVPSISRCTKKLSNNQYPKYVFSFEHRHGENIFFEMKISYQPKK